MPWLSLIILLLLIPLIPTAYAGWIGAPYAPTRGAVVRKAFDQFGVGADDVVVDLGAGDGKILLAAADSGAKAIGYELSPLLWLVAWWRTRHRPRVAVRWRNFYKASIGEATIVFAFLMPDNMAKVRAYLQRQQFQRGKFCMVYAFPFPDVVPLRVIQAPRCAPLYVYDLKDITSLDRG